MAAATAADIANSAKLCAMRAEACAANAVSARTRADEALSATDFTSCPMAKKKAISCAKAAGGAAEVAEAVATTATMASKAAEQQAKDAERAAVADQIEMALMAVKTASSLAIDCANASAAAASAAATAMAEASKCERICLKAAMEDNIETERGFLITANSVFVSIAAQNIVGKSWPAKAVPIVGYTLNHAVLGGCLAVQGVLVAAQHKRTMTNCKIVFLLITLMMVIASAFSESRSSEEALSSTFALVGFGFLVASVPTGLIYKPVDFVRSLFGYPS